MRAMILAAGRGKRMGSLTLHRPKPLVQLNGRTLIEYNILKLVNAGIKEIVINLSWLGDKIKNYLGNGDKWDLNITYLDEGDYILGTGGAVLNALPVLGDEPFWLLNADIYTDYIFKHDFMLNDKSLGHLVLVRNPDHNLRGDFSLINSKVAPKCKNGIENIYTFSGISLLSSKLFDGVNDKVFQLGPFLRKRASEGFISGEIFNGLWFDVGSKERLDSLTNLLSK